MRTSGTERRAAAGFLAPFVVLFAAFFVLPIGYAIYQSLLKVERAGPLGLGGARTVFAGLSNYRDALTDSAFTDSILRVLLFAAVVGIHAQFLSMALSAWAKMSLIF